MSASRSMSLYTATCLVVANMVGTGVFTSVGFQVAAGLSPFAILVLWVVGGVCAFCGGVAYAELAAALPRSGGEYHFLARVFHPAVGFLAGWTSITVGFAAPVALAGMALGKYVHGVWPELRADVTAAVAVAVVTAMLLASPKTRRWFQNGATSLKITLILVFIVAGIIAPGTGASLAPAAGDGAQIFSGEFAASLVFVMYAYSGWNASTYVAGEVRNPARNVALSMAIGTIVVMILYVALNAVFLRITPGAELSGQAEAGLIAGRYAFGDTGGRAMGLLISLGLLSTISAMQWVGPRVLATMGEDHCAFHLFASPGGLPLAATLAQTAIIAALLITGTFESVLTYVQFTLTLSSFLAVLGVFVLRRREPDLPRPVRAWGYPATPLIFLIVSGWMLWHVFREKPSESFAGLGTLLAGLAVFHFSRRN